MFFAVALLLKLCKLSQIVPSVGLLEKWHGIGLNNKFQ